MLARAQCPMDIWKPILLWHMTRDEFLLRDFVVRWLTPEFEAGRFAIRTEDVLDYFATLEAGPARQAAGWSESNPAADGRRPAPDRCGLRPAAWGDGPAIRPIPTAG